MKYIRNYEKELDYTQDDTIPLMYIINNDNTNVKTNPIYRYSGTNLFTEKISGTWYQDGKQYQYKYIGRSDLLMYIANIAIGDVYHPKESDGTTWANVYYINAAKNLSNKPMLVYINNQRIKGKYVSEWPQGTQLQIRKFITDELGLYFSYYLNSSRDIWSPTICFYSNIDFPLNTNIDFDIYA